MGRKRGGAGSMPDADRRDGPPVKRIAGVLWPDGDEGRLRWTLEALSELWGAPDLVGEPVPFTLTDYYRDIAPRLVRTFLCFPGLVGAGGLADWKRQSCAVEARSRTPRAVNVDPGYVDGARLVLASTKDHAHRIWLRDGVYAEVTMRFRFGRWTSFDYTFPDFRSGAYDGFLGAVRERWLAERPCRAPSYRRLEGGARGGGEAGRSPSSEF